MTIDLNMLRVKKIGITFYLGCGSQREISLVNIKLVIISRHFEQIRIPHYIANSNYKYIIYIFIFEGGEAEHVSVLRQRVDLHAEGRGVQGTRRDQQSGQGQNRQDTHLGNTTYRT
jgi:hypothetical protein